jgi:adenylyl-sulfate kinase
MATSEYDHQGAVLWFTGLSASGKTTISNLVDVRLRHDGIYTFVLDGDILRSGLNLDLGFSPKDRAENIRRIGQVAGLFVKAGIIVLVAAISPYRRDRDNARALVPSKCFVEIFVDTSLEICEKRDPKGLYRKARAGELTDFTGIDAPYEPPCAPELVLSGGTTLPDELVDEVVEFLRTRGLVPLGPFGTR